MTATIGWTAAMLGLVSSFSLCVQGLRAQRHPDRVERSRLVWPAVGMLVAAVGAMLALEFALLTDDFSVGYVAENSARGTPLIFKISTAWSALAGSILLWTLVLAGYTAALMRQVRSTGDRLGTGALAVMGAVGVFFFGLVVSYANPFQIIADPPADGPGPNPILQNHLMVLIHPPLLYLGFVGFTVPFAFGISALLLRQGGVDWVRRTRRSNLVAWSFLTGGLVYGAWWSYEVLGWGGYWAWDPVENAAFIPWLLATAFIHSSVVQVKRGMLQSWNFVLVLATFSMTILGTFLTRSSVIVSVHSFSGSSVGKFFLGFFVVVLAGGLLLFAFRGGELANGRRPEALVSREGLFLLNNVLLTVFAFVVLLGTVYPVLVEAVTGDQVSVGRPFFDRMAIPLAFALVIAMGVGPFTPYRKAGGAVMWSRLRWPLLAAALVAVAVVAAGVRSAATTAMLSLFVFVAAGSVGELVRTAPALRPRPVYRLLRANRGYWGGQLAHLGVALVAVAIALGGSMAARASVTLDPGETTSFAGYTVRYDGQREVVRPDRQGKEARLTLLEDGRVVKRMSPRLTNFNNSVQAVGTPDVWTTPTRDIYVALSSLGPRRIGLNLYRYPFRWVLWAGGSLAMLGGLWAVVGRRPRRRPAAAEEAAAPVVEADAGV